MLILWRDWCECEEPNRSQCDFRFKFKGNGQKRFVSGWIGNPRDGLMGSVPDVEAQLEFSIFVVPKIMEIGFSFNCDD